ncbi:MAG: alpha/beta fold hydrolase [Myxococcales bacterium]|nr:alpha/beta fold hydrolase [Myxococcales bacterium]
MVHGNPTWSFYYRNLIVELRKTHRCIAPDHVGMGLSDKPPDSGYPYTLQARIDDLTALLATLQLAQPLTLVVHDWGGMIGMAWATQHPQLIGKLVILNTAAFPLPPSKPFPWQLRLTRTWLGALLVRGFNMFSWTATHAAMTRNSMPAAVRGGYTAPYDSWTNRIATLRFVQDIPLAAGQPGFDIVRATAAKLGLFAATPTYVGWGGQDFVFDDHFLAEWRRYFPHALVNYLADAGHYVLEDAASELVPAICAFVREG